MTCPSFQHNYFSSFCVASCSCCYICYTSCVIHVAPKQQLRTIFLIRAPNKVEILMNDVSDHNINISTCKIKHTPIPNFHKRVCLMNFFNLSFVALLVSFAKTQKVDKFFYKMYFTEPFFIVRLTFNSFQSSAIFPYPMETPENQRFSDVFRWYRNVTLD